MRTLTLQTSGHVLGFLRTNTTTPPSRSNPWNRLPSLGLHAPQAPAYGSGRYNFETLRESELFADEGSKTVVFRPFQQVNMSLAVRNTGSAQIGTYTSGVQIDGGNLFGAASSFLVATVPAEYMPRFGRQDIPTPWVSRNLWALFWGKSPFWGLRYQHRYCLRHYRGPYHHYDPRLGDRVFLWTYLWGLRVRLRAA